MIGPIFDVLRGCYETAQGPDLYHTDPNRQVTWRLEVSVCVSLSLIQTVTNSTLVQEAIRSRVWDKPLELDTQVAINSRVIHQRSNIIQIPPCNDHIYLELLHMLAQIVRNESVSRGSTYLPPTVLVGLRYIPGIMKLCNVCICIIICQMRELWSVNWSDMIWPSVLSYSNQY